MSAHTDGTLMDDSEVIEMLKRVDLDSHPPQRRDIDELLSKGRRARRHRRALLAPASSLGIVGVAALVFAMGQTRPSDRHLFLAPTGLTAPQPHPSVTQPDSNYDVLQEALGGDFAAIDPQKGNPGGNVTVRPGSPSAEGLPTGLTLWTQIFVLQQSSESGELAQFCKSIVEKNVIFSVCTTRVLPDGKTVYVQESRTGPGGIKPGLYPDYLASDGVRVLFEQPDGNLVVVDLSTQDTESNSTIERRAAARAWLDSITPRLVNAATDARVDVDANLSRGPKPSPGVAGSGVRE
jgi:hypothetical protein